MFSSSAASTLQSIREFIHSSSPSGQNEIETGTTPERTSTVTSTSATKSNSSDNNTTNDDEEDDTPSLFINQKIVNSIVDNIDDDFNATLPFLSSFCKESVSSSIDSAPTSPTRTSLIQSHCDLNCDMTNNCNNNNIDDNDSIPCISNSNSTSTSYEGPTVETNAEDEMTNSSLSFRYSQVSASVASLFTVTSSRSRSTSSSSASKHTTTAHHSVQRSISSSKNSPSFDVSCSNNHSDLLAMNDDENLTDNSSSSSEAPTTISTTIVNAANCNYDPNCNISCNNCPVSSTFENNIIPTENEGMNISRHDYRAFLTVGRHLVQSSATMPVTSASISTRQTNNSHEEEEQVHLVSNTTTSTNCNPPPAWYSKIIGDDDLKQYGQVAEELLSVIEPELNTAFVLSSLSSAKLSSSTVRNRYKPMIEPPELNKEEIAKYCSRDNDVMAQCDDVICDNNKTTNYNKCDEIGLISQFLPKAFICPLCNNVLVGSILLDCGCINSAYCITCIEKEQRRQQQSQITATRKKKEVENDDGFVMVYHDQVAFEKCFGEHGAIDRRSQHICPQCSEIYNNAIPCHNLDVAILNAMRNTGKDDDMVIVQVIGKDEIPAKHAIRSIKSIYYQRLNNWKEEFHRRQKSDADVKKQILLSQFISDQEAIMDELKCKKKEKDSGFIQRLHLDLNQSGAEITFLAAALIGINLFLFRKWTW